MEEEQRTDFVDVEVARLEKIVNVVDTKIPAAAIQRFFTRKDRPIIYGAFVASMLGNTLGNGRPLSELSDVTLNVIFF